MCLCPDIKQSNGLNPSVDISADSPFPTIKRIWLWAILFQVLVSFKRERTVKAIYNDIIPGKVSPAVDAKDIFITSFKNTKKIGAVQGFVLFKRDTYIFNYLFYTLQ